MIVEVGLIYNNKLLRRQLVYYNVSALCTSIWVTRIRQAAQASWVHPLSPAGPLSHDPVRCRFKQPATSLQST